MKLTSIRPGLIARKGTKKLGSAKNFISSPSFFSKTGSASVKSGIGGIAQGKVTPAPNGIAGLISNISQTITGGDTNNININKLIGDKLSQLKDKVSGGMQMPNLDGLMNSFSGIADYMKSFTNPESLNGITSGFESLTSSLQKTLDLVTTVRKVISKLVKEINSADLGGGGAGGSILPQAGAGLLGAGLAGAAGAGAAKKGLGFAKFLSSKKSLALMGLGGLGMAAMSSGDANAAEAADISTQSRLMDVGQEGNLTEDQIALFNSTVERFNEYLEDAKKTKPSAGGSKSAPKSPRANPPGPGPGPGPGSAFMGAQGPAGEATRSLLDTIAFAEGTAHKPNDGYNTHFGFDQTQDLSKHPDIVKHSNGISSAAFGRYQFMPATWANIMGGSMEPARQDTAAVRLIIRRLNNAGIKVKDENELETLLQNEGLSQRISAALAPEWASVPTAAGTSYHDQPVKKLELLQKVFAERLVKQKAAARAAGTTVNPQTGTSISANPATAAAVAQQPPSGTGTSGTPASSPAPGGVTVLNAGGGAGKQQQRTTATTQTGQNLGNTMVCLPAVVNPILAVQCTAALLGIVGKR